MVSTPTVSEFLNCETPRAWVEEALCRQDILLIDHANCEKKAASTALSLMFRYVDRTELLRRMSRLAREELRHFEQVLNLLVKRKIDYVHVSASSYAEGLRSHVRRREPDRLIDLMIVGAFIEARSCERFQKLAPFLDLELGDFYRSLLKSEGRHFQDYLKLAETYATTSITPRVTFFAAEEAALILRPDPCFRFHSGVPATSQMGTGHLPETTISG